MSRAKLAALLNVSPLTLTKWESGKSQVRTYKLWEIYDRLEVLSERDQSNEVVNQLIGIFDELIGGLRLANVEKNELRVREISKKLSKTILKAAQTDFALGADRRTLVPVPFTEDLELFRNTRLVDIEQLLQSIVANIQDTLPHLENANINSERLRENLLTYVEEANRDTPNPRILHRKGEIIRRNINDSETRGALSGWDTSALDGFVDDHQELMRLYFGEALMRSQEVERASISDRVVPEAVGLVRAAIQKVEEFSENSAKNELYVDPRIPAILAEMEHEVRDYEAAWRSSNSPTAKSDAAGRIKTSIKHVGIFLGRLVLRVSGLGARAAVGATQVLASIEVLLPGSFKVIYETIRLSFPALPPLF